jgi:hypothetical protein
VETVGVKVIVDPLPDMFSPIPVAVPVAKVKFGPSDWTLEVMVVVAPPPPPVWSVPQENCLVELLYRSLEVVVLEQEGKVV